MKTVSTRMVDLSIAIEAGLPSDPPMMIPHMVIPKGPNK
jgi:hypothetical protein